ncbi:MAG: hypothetical protein ACI32C_03590 [Candidatus Enteromonas sp.]
MLKCNKTKRMALGLMSPNEAEIADLQKLMDDTGEVRCPRLLKRFTSTDN